jgi:signal transduction histidine kinase
MNLPASLMRTFAPRGPRLGSVFLVGAGVVGAISALLPGPPDMNRRGLAVLCAVAVALGVVAWILPWERWPWWSNLLLLSVALALLAVGNVLNGSAPYSYGSLYVVAFVWVGIAQRPGTGLLMSPILVLSYLLPLLTLPGDFAVKASSLILVLPTCVMVAELLARARRRTQRAEERLRAYSGDLEITNRVLIERDRDLRSVLGELQRVEAERRNLLDRTVDSLEEERKRIAIELHDGPIQHLTALDYGLEVARSKFRHGDGDSAMEWLGRAQELARDDVAGLRHLMKDLRPPVLDEHGLASALDDYAASLADEARIKCSVDVDLPVRLDPTLEIVLYRVTQEALTNVAKHARAEHAEVTLRVRGATIELDVRDDGTGIDQATRVSDSMAHYGLLGMRQRIEMVGGSLELHANPGGGTWVHVAVPLHPLVRSADHPGAVSDGVLMSTTAPAG